MGRLIASAIVLSALSASACDALHLGPERTAYEIARERWDEVRPERYVYAVERLCFCPVLPPGRVTVHGDEVVSIEPLGDAPFALLDVEEWYPSVDGLFELLEDAIEREAHSIDATYDPETGIPTEFFIDYRESVSDEELRMRVTEPVTALEPEA